jgi:hypothetical protein
MGLSELERPSCETPDDSSINLPLTTANCSDSGAFLWSEPRLIAGPKKPSVSSVSSVRNSQSPSNLSETDTGSGTGN